MSPNPGFATWTVHLYNVHIAQADGACRNRVHGYARSQGSRSACVHRVGAYSRAEAIRAAINEHRFMTTCTQDDLGCLACHPRKAATA